MRWKKQKQKQKQRRSSHPSPGFPAEAAKRHYFREAPAAGENNVGVGVDRYCGGRRAGAGSGVAASVLVFLEELLSWHRIEEGGGKREEELEDGG